MNKKYLILGAVGFFLIAGIAITLLLLKNSQDVRSRAQALPTPAITATPGVGSASPTAPLAQINDAACPAPAATNNVLVDFPNCEGINCSFTDASCTWDASADATTYNVTITEVEAGTQVKQESLATGVLKTVFPVTQGKTYKCEVSAKNACGATGAATSHQLLCVVDAMVSPTEAPTPTIAPTATPTPTVAPTNTPIPTKSIPTGTPPQAGSYAQTIGILGGVMLAIIGGILLLTL